MALDNERGFPTTGMAPKPVDLTPLTTIGSGQKTLSGSTAEVLASDQQVRSVTIKALSANSNNIYVGANGVLTTSGLELAAKESVSLDIENLNKVYVVGTSGEGVSYVWLL